MEKILQQIKCSLEYQQLLGLETLPKGRFCSGETVVPQPSPLGQPLRSPALEAIKNEIGDCTRCPLHKGRKNIVFGNGNPNANLMFIGEAPGRDEDIQGLPFVGRAGQLLNKIIEAMGTRREEVYVGNINKCRPPDNRAPLPNEVEACLPFIRKQVQAIRPKVIVCLGSVAVQNLLQTQEKISRLRGCWQEFEGTQVMPTYHPAFLLRNPDMKKPVWEDMQKVMSFLKERRG